MISPGVFLIVLNFSFFGLLEGKREKYSPKWKLSHALPQEQYILWSWILPHLCKMMISPGFFVVFLVFGFSRLLGREKGKKWPRVTKKFCLLHVISQEPYIIWLSFMVHLCKMMMSPGVFFTILIPWAVRSKTRKNSVCCAPYFRNHTLHDFDLWYSCVEW